MCGPTKKNSKKQCQDSNFKEETNNNTNTNTNTSANANVNISSKGGDHHELEIADVQASTIVILGHNNDNNNNNLNNNKISMLNINYNDNRHHDHSATAVTTTPFRSVLDEDIKAPPPRALQPSSSSTFTDHHEDHDHDPDDKKDNEIVKSKSLLGLSRKSEQNQQQQQNDNIRMMVTSKNNLSSRSSRTTLMSSFFEDGVDIDIDIEPRTSASSYNSILEGKKKKDKERRAYHHHPQQQQQQRQRYHQHSPLLGNSNCNHHKNQNQNTKKKTKIDDGNDGNNEGDDNINNKIDASCYSFQGNDDIESNRVQQLQQQQLQHNEQENDSDTLEDGDNDNNGNDNNEDNISTTSSSSTTTTITSCSSSRNITFEASCRLMIKIGVAAYKYGSVGANVETFLENAAYRLGYHHAVFRLSQSELFASIQETSDDSCWPIQFFINIQDGFHLEKLGLVVEVAKAFLNHDIQLGQAMEELEKIHEAPDPFSSASTFLSFMAVGSGLCMVLGGSWWDVIMGSILGGFNFVLLQLFAKVPKHIQKWSNTCCAFGVSLITALIKTLYLPHLNVTMITLSALAIQLPGYGVSLGISELASNRIIAGMAHFIQGLVTLLSLALGAWLGVAFVERVVKQAQPLEEDSIPVDMIWQLLFVPLLFVSLGIAFQISHRDFPWMLMNLSITYGVSFLMSQIISKNLGTFLSAVAFTLVANIWGRYMDRPNTILLLPSIVMSVSGSIGFQGLINLVNGETYVGANQFVQMFIIAVMTFGGILVGSSLYPPETTL